MSLQELPRSAAWRHIEVPDGFEVVFISRSADGVHLIGTTTAADQDEVWQVQYDITLDRTWTTRAARISGRSSVGGADLHVTADGSGRWQVNGARVAHLDGCLDVDLESSALTNALPIHRLGLAIDDRADVPAAYIRAQDLAVERLDQRYERLGNDQGHARYRYQAPRFDFECELVYDSVGLVLDYPGIAIRAA